MVKLSSVRSGSKVAIKSVDREEYRFSLYNMGLYPGSSVRVVFNDGVSIVVVDVDGALVALSYSLADSLNVEVVEGG